MFLQSTIQQYRPSTKFLLLLSFFLMGLGIASVVQALVLTLFADIKSPADMVNLQDLSNPKLVMAMKIGQAVSFLIAFVIPSFLFAHFVSEQKISYLKLDRGILAIVFISVTVLIFTIMPVINWMGEINQKMNLPDFMSGVESWMRDKEENLKKLTEAFLKMESAGDLMVNLFVIAFLAAIGEELFFRGCMQNVLLLWTKNIHVAVWITAIFFSAMHLQFLGFFPRLALGVVLGYLYVWTHSLWTPILFHFLNNGVAVLFAYLIGREIIPAEAETIGSGTTPVYYVWLSAFLSAWFMYLIYKSRKEQPLSIG